MKGKVTLSLFVLAALLASCSGLRFGAADIRLKELTPKTLQVELQKKAEDSGIEVSEPTVVADFQVVGPSPGVSVVGVSLVFLNPSDEVISDLSQHLRAQVHIDRVDRGQTAGANYEFSIDMKPFAQVWLREAGLAVEQGREVPYRGWKLRMVFELRDDNGNLYEKEQLVPISVSVKGPIAFGFPPAVSWVRPSAGSVLSGDVELEVSASDNVAVAGVRFYAGSNLIAEDTDGDDGYTAVWDTTEFPDGEIELKAVAYDAAGFASEATIAVVLANEDKQPPAVSWVRPSAGSVLSGDVELEVSASDNVAVAGVRFYAGSNLIAEDTDGDDGYTAIWDTTEYPDGEIELKAVAYDANGNSIEQTTTVTLANAPTIRWVKIAREAAAPGMRLAGVVALEAEVEAPRGVERVAFYVRGEGIGEALISEAVPNAGHYVGSLEAYRFTPDNYELIARVWDHAGVSTESTLRVEIADPFVIITPREGDAVGPEASRDIVAITVGLNGTLFGQLGTVQQVEIFINGEYQGPAAQMEASEDVAYVYEWDTTVASPGHDPTKSGDRMITVRVVTDTQTYLTPGVRVNYLP